MFTFKYTFLDLFRLFGIASLVITMSSCIKTATGSGLGAPVGAQAVPGYHKAQQPDGHSFNLRKKGDEWKNWHETSEGYAVIFNNTNSTWYYAICKNKKLFPGSVKVGEKISASWPKARQLLSVKCK